MDFSNHSSPLMSQYLILSIAEQLKVPLLNIVRSAELARSRQLYDNINTIEAVADAALELLDAYLLGVHFAVKETYLDVEPVSIPSMLYDVGHQLASIAKMYEVQLDLRLEGKYAPVIAHRQGLQAAFVSLGYALVEALPAMAMSRPRLQLSVHRCRYGIVAGMYCDAEQITMQMLRQGRQLYGRARQPLVSMSHTSGAGIFVADAIFHSMSARLMASRHHKLHGLGVVLRPSLQMQLV